ncbi:MAG: HD domain-containing protein [Desulfofustis sp.]|nr:HD domain-containing protein [Desulfofustis sp.]NNF47009.1 HD domain-containing protein [Desulfofustis sp.]
MKFPALKKEIHALLIKRLTGICILTILLVVGATCYIEYSRLEQSLISAAIKEARLFIPLFLNQHNNHSGGETVVVTPEFHDSIAHTSFIEVRLSTPDGLQFFEKSRASAEQVRHRFNDKSVSLVPGGEPVGTWLFADKRLYLMTVIPIRGLQDDDILGHLEALYRSSLADTKAIGWRFVLSSLIGAGAVVLCGLIMYPGLVFFHNRLIKIGSDLNLANNFLLKKLGSALAKSDVGVAEHNYRVLIYGIRLAERHKLSRARIRNLIQGIFLHDVGMLDLDVSILLKQGPLDKKELSKVQEHVKNGVAQIKRYRWLRDGLDVVRCHHEKYDGSGYPAGLSQDKIPLEARIFAIVDAFDALTSQRPYRQPQEIERGLAVLEQESGSHFDPVLLAPFIEMAPQLYNIVNKLKGKALEKEVRGVVKKYVKL